ncbi:MAG: hypothetical protein R2739_01830 [Chitinophagales bacterium]|nr:DUF2157 domain-containing protein [Bacteroidota bacterium]
MLLEKKDSNLLKRAIDEWESQNVITTEQASQMRQQLQIRKFDWKLVAVYAFIIAVLCAVLAIIVLLSDKTLRELIEKFTKLTDITFSIILSICSILVFWLTKKRLRVYLYAPITNNSFLMLGAFLSLSSVTYWAKSFNVFHNEYYGIFFIATIIYVGLSVYFKSNTLWALSILMFGLTYGAFTLSFENEQQFFFGMNLLLRYIPFSFVLFLMLFYVKRHPTLNIFKKLHYIFSLLIFYTALWLLSIFGNFTKYEHWQQVGQFHFVVWAIVLFLTAVIGMYIGLKKNDYIIANISLSFFIINLLTRYFEYFWEPLHKSIFFMILAIFFWFIGNKAEKLWNLRFLNENGANS